MVHQEASSELSGTFSGGIVCIGLGDNLPYVENSHYALGLLSRFSSDAMVIAGSPRSCLFLKLALRRCDTVSLRGIVRGIVRGIEVCHIYVNEQYGSNILGGGVEKY